ncbi:response regulator transcription factor [Sulfurospirillum oryzae]|uniref:response regulator transcription factor n=1 Tax=Sulfurospirillum oryzae TaxID=2976535 RepID=UPI0021E7F21F|nr:response regulator [Sulfurospirillum oryzae]
MQTIEVLIADDSNLVLKVITKALLENKFDHYCFEESKIHYAHDGMEAFEIMGKNRNISMLISDINMPHLNGDDLVEVLIDTNLHQKILTVFITANEDVIKHSTKKHTIGTIQKPFNHLSFNMSLNELVRKHHEKKAHAQKKYASHKTQITKALQNICQKHPIGHQINEKKFEALLDAYLDASHVIPEDEIEFVFYAMIDDLFKASNITLKLSQNELKAALNSVSNKQHNFTLALKACINDSIESCKELLAEKKEIPYHSIMEELLSPINNKASILRNKVIHYRPKKYALLSPYMEPLLEHFEKIDYAIRDEYLSELLAYTKEIEEFSQWISDYCRNNSLERDLPQFKNAANLFKELYEKYNSVAIHFNKMQHYITGEIERHLLYKVLSSKEISSYMKKHLPDVIPTTSNILLHLKKIDQTTYKKLAENDFQYLAVLSLDIDFLAHFKEKYEQICTHTKIFCFSKTTFFEDWIGNNKVDKLVIDYDFSTNVFASGLVYLKYFLKQNSKKRALAPLQRYNRYYLVASQHEAAKEKEHLHSLNAHIIEKPLYANDVKNILLYS